MHLSEAWLVPLCVSGAGAIVLTVAAAALRREIDRLQKAMRVLRVRPSDKGTRK